jgi:hypothetical protein
MKTMPSPISAIYTSLFAILILYLCFYCLREYRIEQLRQRLFGIRDELFDFAAEGYIEFSHPAYTASRMTINSLIRYSHRITVSRVFLAMVWPSAPMAEPRLRAAMAEFPEGTPVREKLTLVHARVARAVLIYLLTGCPLLFGGLLFAAIHLFVTGAFRRISDVLLRLAVAAPGIQQIEALAVDAEAVM